MKLLIISGPYEADRLRKAAVSAGFEAVAVEPGESLSGWITASRPALIIMAPQMVHPDPTQALARVRSVPRGRVPIFLVGDSADEPHMAPLADGFFIRPVAPDELLERARAVLTASGNDGSNGAGRRAADASGPVSIAAQEFAQGARTPRGGPHTARPAVLKPLKARVTASAPRVPPIPRPAGDATALLAKLSAGIDELFEADLSRALASAPRTRTAPEGEHEFDDMPTDDRRQRSAADRRVAVLARYALIEEGDYFEILGIARDASAADIQLAHDRIARELAPDAIDPPLATELGEKLDAIREVVGEALRVLGDEILRPRYTKHLP
jgi:DNA-binding response OmpR family regulator